MSVRQRAFVASAGIPVADFMAHWGGDVSGSRPLGDPGFVQSMTRGAMSLLPYAYSMFAARE